MNSFEKQVLDAHNKHRANHQAPQLAWNSRLASDAQEWADWLARENRLKHATTNDGENIYTAFGNDVSGDEVVSSWYDEVKNYSFGRPGFQSSTGHFSQVVWKGSRELGVGRAVAHDGKVFVVVRYRPPGNNLRTFDENVAPFKSGFIWNEGWSNRVNYDDRKTSSKPDPYKRHSGRWDYSTEESMHNRQQSKKRYSDGWDAVNVNDDRSWIQREAPPKNSSWSEPGKQTSTRREAVKIKNDQSWIQKKGSDTIPSWSEPRKGTSNGYDYVTIANVKLYEEAPNRSSGRPESRKQIREAWDPDYASPNRNTTPMVSSRSEQSMRIYEGWDRREDNNKQKKNEKEEAKASSGRWDPISDYNKTVPPTQWDSGNWFESANDSTASETYQAPPTRTSGTWDDDHRLETQPKEKTTKRHSGRWQPGVNDVMFKEPQQERIFSTSKEPWKKQKATGKAKNMAERWEKSSQDQSRESNDKWMGWNGNMETDGMRYHSIQAGKGKTRESIRRWEQSAMDQPLQPDQSSRGNKTNKSNQSVPYRSSQSQRSTQPSQSSQSYPSSQSNRYSWPNQSKQSDERWDPLWQEDRPYSQKQRPASIEGTKVLEDKIQNFQMDQYQSSPYGEPRERKITTTIVDGPKKTVVSSLTITLKGNEGRIGSRSKSSEDLRPRSSYSRGSRTPERQGYTAYPYAEARKAQTGSRSKSSEDLRSRGTYASSTRTPIKEDILVAKNFKPEPRQQNFDTTDGYRTIKPVSKFPSLPHFAQQALETHNFYRALHGVPNLIWSPELADSAQAWAEKLAKDRSLKHTTRERGGDGENVAILTGASKNAAKDATDTWYKEIKNYNFNKPGYHPKAGHFTQLVWKESKEFGMGCATSSDRGSVVVVGRYRPGGNVLRQYELNVFPNVDIFDF